MHACFSLCEVHISTPVACIEVWGLSGLKQCYYGPWTFPPQNAQQPHSNLLVRPQSLGLMHAHMLLATLRFERHRGFPAEDVVSVRLGQRNSTIRSRRLIQLKNKRWLGIDLGWMAVWAESHRGHSRILPARASGQFIGANTVLHSGYFFWPLSAATHHGM